MRRRRAGHRRGGDIRRVDKACHNVREKTPQVNPTTGSLSMSTTHTHTHLHSFAFLPSTPRLSKLDTRATHPTHLKPYISRLHAPTVRFRRRRPAFRRVGHDPDSSTSIGEGDVRRPTAGGEYKTSMHTVYPRSVPWGYRTPVRLSAAQVDGTSSARHLLSSVICPELVSSTSSGGSSLIDGHPPLVACSAF
jgi:hypothetical protein